MRNMIFLVTPCKAVFLGFCSCADSSLSPLLGLIVELIVSSGANTSDAV